MENNKLFRFWVNYSMRNLHVSLGVIAVASWLVGNLSKNANMHILAEVIALFTIAHFFIHGYFYRQQKFLSDNQRVYSLPKKKIARTGGLFLAGFMVAVSVGMAVVREIYSGTLWAKLQTMFLYLLAVVFGAVIDTGGLGKDDLLLNDNPTLLEAMNQIAKKEDSAWENVVNSIQTILIVVGVILLVVLCVVLIINYIRHLAGNVKFDIIDKSGRNISDREEHLGGKLAKREKLFDFSPAAKARRIYRRCINRQRRNGQAVPEWMSPAEIETMVLLPNEEKYHELHNIYEKARYSEFGCTEEEAQRAKTLKA